MGTVPHKMYAYAIPRQYTMLFHAPYVMIPLFRAGAGLFHAMAVNGLNRFPLVCCGKYFPCGNSRRAGVRYAHPRRG